MSYKWTDYRSGRVAKRLGKFPYQFVFNQDGRVFHHHTAKKKHEDCDCWDEAFECDSDMTFTGALVDTLKGEKEPCPVCLPEFPTTVEELSPNHMPEKTSMSYDEFMHEFSEDYPI